MSDRATLAIALQPVAGTRFQPTGFPDLGAATFQRPGDKIGEWVEGLHVESPQSMANRMELSTWDEAGLTQVPELDGLPYVQIVNPDGEVLTSSRVEAHRLASAYIMEGVVQGTGKTGLDWLPARFDLERGRAINRHALVSAIFELDPLSLIHGVFFARKSWPWQPKIARAVTAFIDADDVRPAYSGGVKTDSVDHSGATELGYGMVPHQRTEYTARSITAFVTTDTSQLRSYGLGPERTELLEAIIDFELAHLFRGDGLRLRTACDLVPVSETTGVPSIEDATARVQAAIQRNGPGEITTVVWHKAKK